MAIRGKEMMKRLATVTLLSVLTACAGCESTPVTSTPATPVMPVTPVAPAEAEAKFAIGDEVIITMGDDSTLDGTIVDVGPMAEWMNSETKEVIASRVYLVSAVVNGQPALGKVPEFALVRKREPMERNK